MGENTKIEWADHTFNPWVGCAKVSPACTNCYAEGWAKRTGQSGLWRGERRRTSAANWRKPLKWNRETPGARVFCSSLADVFEERDDLIEWRWDLMRLIRETPTLMWLLLTKRPDHMARWFERVDTVPENVWVGTTVEDQQRADERIPHLLRVPAPVRFLSMEPLLGPVDLTRIRNGGGDVFPRFSALQRWTDGKSETGIDWVITGGESGLRARPSHPDWFRSLRDQCAAAGVMFHFKQWGEWAPMNGGPGGDIDEAMRPRRAGFFDYRDRWNGGGANPFRQSMGLVGKARAGRLLDGRTHDEVPR